MTAIAIPDLVGLSDRPKNGVLGVIIGVIIMMMAMVTSNTFNLDVTTNPEAVAESICPTGASPRSDISWCADFEDYDDASCITGGESACATANGITVGGGGYDFLIKSGDAAVGNGAISGISTPGGTGPGFSAYTLPSTTNAVNYRFYVKFTVGYIHSTFLTGHHGPAIEGSANGCNMRATLDWHNAGALFRIQQEGTCSHTYNLPNTITDVELQNNRWYLVEMHFTIDTTCTDTGDHDCDGIGKAWIDGTQVLEYTDLNLGGADKSVLFSGGWAARSYYGLGPPAWSHKIHFDNFAVSDNGTYIGAALWENLRGTADTKSPYINFGSYNGMMAHKLAPDCSAPGGYLNYVPSGLAFQWRDGGTLQTTVANGAYDDQCTSDTDQSFKINLTSTDTGGGVNNPFRANPFLAIHGYIYLDSSNDYSADTPLTGFTKYGVGDIDHSNYIAMSAIDNKWAIVQQVDNGTQTTVASAGTVTFDAWHEFELVIEDDDTASLMIDGSLVITSTSLTTAVTWPFTDAPSPGVRSMVLGVIDFQGTQPFIVYYDDADMGTASFWSSDGWDAASSPF